MARGWALRPRDDDQPVVHARCRELRAALPRFIAPDAPTPLWRAIEQAMEAFGDEDDRRKVILVLSDGKDTGPLSFRERPASQGDVIDRARRDDVMIYAIGMRSRPTRTMPPGLGPGGLQAMLLADMPDPGLAKVAEDTGGGYTEIRFGQDLGAAFAAVADELHTQYLLGVHAAEARWQSPRDRRSGQSVGMQAARAKELRRAQMIPK